MIHAYATISIMVWKGGISMAFIFLFIIHTLNLMKIKFSGTFKVKFDIISSKKKTHIKILKINKQSERLSTCV